MPSKPTIAFVLSFLSLVPKASAIVVGGTDPNNPIYLSGQTAVGYSLVPGVGGCSGSLLNTGIHFLTAAHCLLGASGDATVRFWNGSQTFEYKSTSLISHPDFESNNYFASNDIAIITLGQTVDSSINRLALYTGNGELNQVGTLIGRGGTGIGSNGDRTSDGIRREGTNTIDAIINNRILFYDFDDGTTARSTLGSSTPTAREVSIYFGDSGGPTLLNGQIAGVHSFLTCFSGTTSQCATSVDVDGVINATFGERFADTRVSFYAAWIQSITNAPAGSLLDGPANVPEPATWFAGFAAAIVCIARHRRRSSDRKP
ncbi:MAG: S1 family peptidase [Acidobacteria bacterium]|nr:S1 family peptidase [Acidobacteriota bacterium]